MQMRKIFSVLGLFFFLVLFSGCADDNGTAGLTGGLDGSSQKVKKEEQTQKPNSTENDKSGSLNNKDNTMSSALKAPVANQELIKKYPFAMIKTSLGDIKVKFSSTSTPVTVTNFLQLATNKFYDGIRFHRVIKGFMIQAGDPLSKDDAAQNSWGTGGPGYKFNDELAGSEKYSQGTLAMANAGPNTNGSQFFIVTASPAAQLPASYTVFGQVVSGIDVALKIENVKTVTPDRPADNVTITSITPLEK